MKGYNTHGSKANNNENQGSTASSSFENSSSEDSEIEGTSSFKDTKVNSTTPGIRDKFAQKNVPMYKLLEQQRLNSENISLPSKLSNKLKKRKHSQDDETEYVNEVEKKRSKNAPAEMRSDKPVRRLRIDGDNRTKKYLDPRFADYTGNLDQKIFSKNFSFLDEMRDNEISLVSKKLKKAKDDSTKAEIKQELLKLKQQANERKLSLKVLEKLETMKSEEKQKVKSIGKKQFYLKNSEKKKIIAEERYAQLKKSGKLDKFMAKKRRREHTKDIKNIPQRRSELS